MRVLVLGASGMLGHTMIRVLVQEAQHEVFASARSASVREYFPDDLAPRIFANVDVSDPEALNTLFERVSPQVVINCVGVVKQLMEADDPLVAIPINSLLPHRLVRLCERTNARLIHVSTDCVFSGRKGGYVETDEPDAQDLYGRSKLLGEVDGPNAITLRTSMIGHEKRTAHGLIEWFLAQGGHVKGYARAIFSGLPTCELARIIHDHVIPRRDMRGVYHVAASPITKLELLQLVNNEYRKNLSIEPDMRLQIDRSLRADRFHEATGYRAPSWSELIAQMRAFG
jgi:dTDP-4-dehydrorhamnose reductase